MLLSVSLSAWLVSSPLSAAFFGYMAPYAVIVNLLLVNLAALTITTGILSISLGLLGLLPISAYLNHASWLSISAMTFIVEGNLGVPGAVIQSRDFPEVVAYSSVILFLTVALMINQSKTRSSLLPLSITIIAAGILVGMVSY